MKALQKTQLLIFLSAFFLFSSCKLDEVLKDTPTPTTVNSESDVSALIVGMYSRFNDSGMFKFLGHIMITLPADDIYSTSGSEYASYSQRTFNSTHTNPMWAGFYTVIRDANNLIALLDEKEFSAAFEKRAYGEAYFIRAFSYYYLVRLYGGVPLRITATDIKSDFYMKRSSIDETYAQIFSDFKKASERLPLAKNIVAGELGRASKGAAQAMLAQAYLTYGNQLSLKGSSPATPYQHSVLYADSVISSNQYTLKLNYGDLFEIAKESAAYEEVIFGIRFQTDNQNRAQPAAGSEFAFSFGAGNTYGVKWGGGPGGNLFRVAHWFADHYRTGDYSNKDALGVDSTVAPGIDYRNEKAFHQRGYNPTTNSGAGRYFAVYPNVPGSTTPGSTADGTINDPILAKYQDPGGKDDRNHGNDFFVLRYAEVLLIKSEALNELFGPTNEAIAPFNLVRTRARTVNGIANARKVPMNVALTKPVGGLLTKDEFRMKIFDERGIEFVGEGGRWFDLVRMSSPLGPTRTMYEYQFLNRLNNQTIYARTLPTYNTTTLQFTTKRAIYAPIINVTVPKFLLFPIPTQELLQNPNFGPQNPDW